jgi:TRAP-type C4-dicarboxylate transport system permease small subunit
MNFTNLTNFQLVSQAHAAGGSFNIDLGSQVSTRVSINSDLGTFISHVFSAIIIVAAIATFIYMIYGGIEWVISGGEKDKIKSARDKITQAIIGLAVVASAWAIFKLIDYFFGIGITK